MFPFRRLNIGERLTQFPAGSWNAIIDFIEKSSGQQPTPPRNSPPPVPPLQLPVQSGAPASGGGIIQVRNFTTRTVPMYGVLGFLRPMNSPPNDPSSPYRQEPVDCTYPSARNPFCIVQPPSDLPTGYTGPAMVSGLTWAKVNYRNKAHTRCHPLYTGGNISDDNVTFLESDHTGFAHIVWLEHQDADDPTNGGYPQWALIHLGSSIEPEFAIGEVDSSYDPVSDGTENVPVKLTRLFTTAVYSVGTVVQAENVFGIEFRVGEKVFLHYDARSGIEAEEGPFQSEKWFAFGAGSSNPLVEFELWEDLGVDRFPTALVTQQLAPTGEEITVTNPLIPFWGYGPRNDAYNDDAGSRGWAVKVGDIYWIVAIEQPVLFALVRLAQDRDEAYIGESGHARFDATVVSDDSDYGIGLHCKPITRIGPDNRVHVWDNNNLAEIAVAGDMWVVAFSAGQYELLCPVGSSNFAIVKGTAQHTVQRTNDTVVIENLEVVQGPLPPHEQITARIPDDAKMDCPSGTELYAFYDVSAGEDDQTRWCAAHKHNHYWIMRGHAGFDQFSSSYERQVLTNQGGTEPEMKWADSEWGGYTADIDVVVDASWNAETCEMTLTKKRLSFTDGRLTDEINLP